MTLTERFDAYQRRHPKVGFPIGVIYKFGEDQGPYLAALITYYGFLSLFPLLLLFTSVLGFVLDGRPELQQEILDSALSQFPVIGDELATPQGLQGSVGAIIVGGLVALYGARTPSGHVYEVCASLRLPGPAWWPRRSFRVPDRKHARSA
ncbi:unannotated protein [freshwater metagenome]|uniref:Unannotated protein n=1 Tax=freshwater metagenome TaxID=449393 RepID=A0A6J7NF92_9ZZZZ|nr:hypothetical protein [Actinomycetota bacterium]